MKPRLTATAVIVNFPELEQGQDKLQRGDALHKTERPACDEFRSPALEQTHAKGVEECSIVKAAFKIRNVVDVAYIRRTSNECERFFFCEIGLAWLATQMCTDAVPRFIITASREETRIMFHLQTPRYALSIA
ncbi:hypothetical protein JG688_00017365 [Phytophthora aleatoria]|uniref:Uncharacterized protein n=1 Tax=Phytophthora aleatoria TaxID=2496075 RepID=A0A8J5M1D6_9STRA|nr:hypothetical protein JG688_00017365 [Phytophthora aleatoria]